MHTPLHIDDIAALTLELARQASLEMSEAQARAIAPWVETTHRGCQRAIALLQSFTTQGKLDNTPRQMWRPEHSPCQITPLVVTYVITGLRDAERHVLYGASFLDGEISSERLTGYLNASRDGVDASLHALCRTGVLSHLEGDVFALPGDVMQWFSSHALWGEDTQAIAVAHARWALKEPLDDHEVLGFYTAAPDIRTLKRLHGKQQELFKAALRIRHIDAMWAAQLVLAVLLYDFFHGESSRFSDAQQLIEELLDGDVTGALSCHMHVARAELLQRSNHAFSHIEAELELALATLESSPAHEESAVRLKRLLYAHFFKLDTVQRELEFDALMARLDDDAPVGLRVTALRYGSRLRHEQGMIERGHELAQRALDLAKNSGEQGLILACVLEQIEGLSRHGDSRELESLCVNALDVIDAKHFPRHAIFLSFNLGLHYFGATCGEDARPHLYEARAFFKHSQDSYIGLFCTMMCASLELEAGHTPRALELLTEMGWPLDVMSTTAYTINFVEFAFMALLYAMCGESYAATRMMLDARGYFEKCTHSDYVAWVNEYVASCLELVNHVVNKAQTSAVTQALQELEAQRRQIAQRERARDGLQYLVQGIDRVFDQWLLGHGIHARSALTMRVDALDVTTFAINHHSPQHIGKRKAIRLILSAMLASARATPEARFTLEDLFAVGWPGELASYDSMQARVYNAVSRMRRLGLDDVIVHDGEGYRFNPSCHIMIGL